MKIRFSRGVRGKKTENDRPPFWFKGESIQTSVHGNGSNAEAADSVVVYDQGYKAQESLRCKVIVWDEATMSNKLALEAVKRTFQDIREISTPLVALQWSSVEISSCANEVDACFKASKLWEHVHVMHLSTNMRVHLHTGTPPLLFLDLSPTSEHNSSA